MFLTRMALDTKREDTQALLQDTGRMQREIRAAFAGGNMQPLFRLETISSRLWLVVLSRLRPSLHAAHERYGYLGAFPSWETLDVDSELEHAEAGTTWDFELNASPVGIAPDPDPAWLEPYRLNQWLARQGEPCGFELREARVTRSLWQPVDENAWLLLADWTGVLTVRDQDSFTWAVSAGIGNGRENGVGLMTITWNPTYREH